MYERNANNWEDFLDCTVMYAKYLLKDYKPPQRPFQGGAALLAKVGEALDALNRVEDAFKWYLDLRKYGSVPHSGFGLGLERTVTWLCGINHLRESIPFPRLMQRLYP